MKIETEIEISTKTVGDSYDHDGEPITIREGEDGEVVVELYHTKVRCSGKKLIKAIELALTD